MPTVTETVTIEMLGEQLFKANEGIHDLKTHVMKLGDDLRAEFGERFDGVDARLDGIEGHLAKIMDHLGIQ